MSKILHLYRTHGEEQFGGDRKAIRTSDRVEIRAQTFENEQCKATAGAQCFKLNPMIVAIYLVKFLKCILSAPT